MPLLPELGDDGRILEGIVTTENVDGSINVSPMGPIVDDEISTFLFRPYVTSTTYANLKRTGTGVFHVTDDVMLFAQAAVGQPDPLPPIDDLVIATCCRWFRFDVRSLDDRQERTEIVAKRVDQGEIRPFLGFNRARHAVLEAAILATRVHLLPHAEILAEFDRLATPVEKTASAVERHAFDYLRNYVDSMLVGAESRE